MDLGGLYKGDEYHGSHFTRGKSNMQSGEELFLPSPCRTTEEPEIEPTPPVSPLHKATLPNCPKVLT